MGESIDEEPATDDEAVRRLKLLKVRGRDMVGGTMDCRTAQQRCWGPLPDHVPASLNGGGSREEGDHEKRLVPSLPPPLASPLQAVEGDDWSAVIDRQTEEVAALHIADMGESTTAQEQAAAGAGAQGDVHAPPPIASPFTQAAVHRQVSPRGGWEARTGMQMGRPGPDGAVLVRAALCHACESPRPRHVICTGQLLWQCLQACLPNKLYHHFALPGGPPSPHHTQVGNQEPQPHVPLNAETVDHALNEVRPFLIADGGNVEVVSVSGGVVSLEFQGACGTCPSSSATMSMGIERCLRATFGTQMTQIVQVGVMAG